MKRVCFFFALGLLLLPFALIGCGGGSSAILPLTNSGPPGRATITVNWPALSKSASRLIPAASNSVVVRIEDNGTTVGTATVVRPSGGSIQSDCTFDSLPVKTLMVVSTAYPNADGTGTAQARVSSPLTITSGKTTALSLTLDSTIVKIDIAANGALTGLVGGSTALTATPRDATGAVVLTSPGNIQWQSSDGSVASIDQTGKVTGSKGGSVTITATETEHNRSGTARFTIEPQLYIVGMFSSNLIRVNDMTGAGRTTLDTGLSHPSGVFVGPDNKIYVSAGAGNRVLRMDDMSGANTVAYSAGLHGPIGIFVSKSNHIYIANYSAQSIVRMDDMTGTNRVEYSTGLIDPSSVYVDADERIYIADYNGSRIVRMDDMSGTNRVEYSAGLIAPFSVWVGKDNKIYIADANANRIVRMDDMSGTNVVTYSTGASGPLGVTTDDSNRIYIGCGSGDVIRIDNMNGDNRVVYASGVGNLYGICLR